MEYGRWFFWITAVEKGSKVSRYETLKQVEKSIGRKPPELECEPELPNGCAETWQIFTSIAEGSYTEIKAYCDLTGTELAQWQIDGIMALSKLRNCPPDWKPERTDG